LGGGGSATACLGSVEDCVGDEVVKSAVKVVVKQGSYGKVVTHKESKAKQLTHVDEVFAAVTLLYIKPLTSNLGDARICATHDKEALEFCDFILGKVSRSFAAVIRQLPSQLLVEVMVFYLVLRALDTVEDDMTAFDNETKVSAGWVGDIVGLKRNERT